MNDPRNVTPEAERERIAEAEATDARGGTTRGDWSGMSWERRGGNFPWLGILLVLVGLALLVQAALPQVSAGTVLLFALGVALVIGWLFGGSWLAAIPGLLLIALGASRLLFETNVYRGAGLTSLSLGIAFLLIWLIGLARQRRSRWPLVAAGIFGLIGLIQISGNLTNIPELGIVWPVVIVVVGFVLIIAARRR
jgi:hypothetical protein